MDHRIEIFAWAESNNRAKNWRQKIHGKASKQTNNSLVWFCLIRFVSRRFSWFYGLCFFHFDCIYWMCKGIAGRHIGRPTQPLWVSSKKTRLRTLCDILCRKLTKVRTHRLKLTHTTSALLETHTHTQKNTPSPTHTRTFSHTKNTISHTHLHIHTIHSNTQTHSQRHKPIH